MRKLPENHCPTCGVKIKLNSKTCPEHIQYDRQKMRDVMIKTNHINSKENSRFWKGDAVGYSALHKWLRKIFGKPNKCWECGTLNAKRFEWANITGLYTRDINNYAMLCKSCHVKLDRYHYKLTYMFK